MHRRNLSVGKQILSMILLTSLSVFSVLVSANAANENEALKQSIANSMSQLLSKLNENKSIYRSDASVFFHDLDIELSHVIDFKRVALKVMGRNVRTATDLQRDQFISIFKRSLFETYANVLLGSDEVEFDVLNANINSRNSNKAKVNLVIKGAGGANYEVSYAMHRGKDLIYRVENIIVLGVNLGLAFKDRFQQQLYLYKGDIDQVIENWHFGEIS